MRAFLRPGGFLEQVSGFSKFTKQEKINWLIGNLPNDSLEETLQKFWHHEDDLQKKIDQFSENTISNYYFPFGLAPNFKINEKMYCVPMAIEESSVVAALSNAAKYWLSRGGFKYKVLDTKKIGQVHFYWGGSDFPRLERLFNLLESKFETALHPITKNMQKRGGGILSSRLVDMTHKDPGYYQVKVEFNTCDAMGANFINSCLEAIAKVLEKEIIGEFSDQLGFNEKEKEIDIIMSILSNYTPDCLVRAWVSCPVEDLENSSFGMSAESFANKFSRALKIADMDPHRATTHNKGIFNGIDAVVLATGNDFRAIEACGHTYAARSGEYKSLSSCEIKDGNFIFSLEIPLALGTIGGLTSLHPLAKASLEILGRPNAEELMGIVASVGLAQNFAAIKSLVTTGIQKGHMKMHLLNILGQLNASEEEIEKAKDFFQDRIISYNEVQKLIDALRRKKGDEPIH